MIIIMTDKQARKFVNKWCAYYEIGGTKCTKPIKIISYWHNYKGKLYWNAIDNSTYDCWCEDFDTFFEALAYLLGKEVI